MNLIALAGYLDDFVHQLVDHLGLSEDADSSMTTFPVATGSRRRQRPGSQPWEGNTNDTKKDARDRLISAFALSRVILCQLDTAKTPSNLKEGKVAAQFFNDFFDGLDKSKYTFLNCDDQDKLVKAVTGLQVKDGNTPVNVDVERLVFHVVGIFF